MLPPEGTFFLVGDLFPQLGNWVEGTKYPALYFPSGLAFELWEASPAPDGVMIHLGGELDAPLHVDRNSAHEMINGFYLPRDFVAIQINDNGIELFGLLPYIGYRLTYDNEQTRLINVEPLPFARLIFQTDFATIPANISPVE